MSNYIQLGGVNQYFEYGRGFYKKSEPTLESSGNGFFTLSDNFGSSKFLKMNCKSKRSLWKGAIEEMRKLMVKIYAKYITTFLVVARNSLMSYPGCVWRKQCQDPWPHISS